MTAGLLRPAVRGSQARSAPSIVVLAGPCAHDRVMTVHRWPPGMPPEELGAVVHGPVLLSRAPGIVAGLRCVVAHPGRLLLPLVVRAEGVQAEAAGRQTFHDGLPLGEVGGSQPQLHVTVDEMSGYADASATQCSGGGDAFSLDADYWITHHPRDGRLHVSIAWPEAGLPETSTVLVLEGLDDAQERIVRLL